MEMSQGPAPRAAARHPDRAEGHLRDRRRADDRPFASARRLCARDRRRDGAAPEGRRRGHPGQARHARVRQRRDDAGPAVPGGAQSLEHRAISPAARRAARAPPSPPRSAWAPWAPTPAARSAIPAGFCGTAGIKPTYGLVSRCGIFPLSFSFDTAGPLAWTVEDSALMLDVLAGHDPNDQGSAKARQGRLRRGRAPSDQGHAHRAGAQLVRGQGADAPTWPRASTRRCACCATWAPSSRTSSSPTSGTITSAAASSSPPRRMPSIARR